MKKVIRKLCVFLIAVIFLCKSLYGDIQYARADEFAGSEVTVTEGEPGEEIDVSGDDVSGDDVSGDDVSGDDVSGDDVSGDDAIDDVSGDDVSGGDIIIEDDPTPEVDEPEGPEEPEEPEPKRNDYVDKVYFFVLKGGYLESIIPEQTGTEVTSNRARKYVNAYVLKKDSEYSFEYLREHFSEIDMNDVSAELKKAVIKNLPLPEEFVYCESITEEFGEKKAYGEKGREYIIEEILGNKSYVRSLFVFFKEQTSDGADTKNVVFASGDMIDWYVLKNADEHGWHTDGYMSHGRVLVHDDNKPVGKEAVYTYDGNSKISDEVAVVNGTIDAADDNLPGTYIVKKVVYKDANGNVVSEIINAGTYSAVATVFYAYEGTGDEASYISDDFEVLFPITVNKRTVTVTAYNNSKTEGQSDPSFSGRVDGAVASDPVTAYFWRILGNEAVGTYPIYSTVVAGSNYNVVSYDGVFTIYSATTTTPTTPETPTPPTEEVPGIVTPEPPAPTPTPEPVAADDTIELDEEDVPLSDGPDVTAELSGDAESLDVGDVYPPLRDLTIEDDETPLAAPGECWIHWLIVLLTAADVLYTVIQAFRNGALIKKFKSENK